MEQTAKEQGKPHFAPLQLVKKLTGGKGGVCLRLLEELDMHETFSSSSRVLHGPSTHLPSASPQAPSSCRVLRAPYILLQCLEPFDLQQMLGDRSAVFLAKFPSSIGLVTYC